MPRFSELVNFAVFRGCGLNVEPLRSWWCAPVYAEHTIEGLLKDSFADSILGDGIWQCISALEKANIYRQNGEEWLNTAVSVVQETRCPKSDTSPFWLLWLYQTVEAIDLVRRCAAEHVNCLEDGILLTGVEFIRNGLPSLAASSWMRARRDARHRAKREYILNKRVAFAVKEASEFAATLSVCLPPLDYLEPEARLAALIRWYDELRDSTILEHFWLDHLEYLGRLREIAPSSEVNALILTAEKRRPVTLVTLRKLVESNRNRTDSLLVRLQALS